MQLVVTARHTDGRTDIGTYEAAIAVTMKIFNNIWLKANFPQNNQTRFRPMYM